MEWIRKYNFRVVIYHSFDENFRIIVLRIEIENNYDLERISKWFQVRNKRKDTKFKLNILIQFISDLI